MGTGEIKDALAWTVEMEVSLLHAMQNRKPVGVNKHFYMASIREKLNLAINKHITNEQIWDHLSTMYDLNALNESEVLPFPNKTLDFSLPESITGVKDAASVFETSSNASLDELLTQRTERDRHGSGSSTRGSHRSDKSEKPVTSQKSSTLLVEELKSEDVTKRKRTRNSLQSNSTENTPKRQRRI